MMETNIFRAIDANLNRVTEGLRVIESTVRFSLNHGPIQQQVKSLRHRLRCPSTKRLLNSLPRKGISQT